MTVESALEALTDAMGGPPPPAIADPAFRALAANLNVARARLERAQQAMRAAERELRDAQKDLNRCSEEFFDYVEGGAAAVGLLP